MWPIGFISFSSSQRKSGDNKNSEKGPVKVSRMNIRVSPAVRHQESRSNNEKLNLVKKRLDFYENNESEEAKRKRELQSFAQLLSSKTGAKQILKDPQKYISKSLQSDDEDGLAVKPVPRFRSSSQFEKYFSESERESPISNVLQLDGVHTSGDSHNVPVNCEPISATSILSTSFVHKSLPDSPQVKRVQFTPIMPTISSKKRPEKGKSSVERFDSSNQLTVSHNHEDSDLEDMSQKEWYQQVFKVVHKLDNLYSTYPIPQIDDKENPIPPRPRSASRKTSTPSSTNKDQRSNSLPAASKTDSASSPLSFMDSKEVFLTKKALKMEETSTGTSSPNQLKVLQNFKKHLENRESVNESPKIPLQSLNFYNKNMNQERATALFDFQAHYSNELSFRRGEKLKIRHKVNDNWFEAEINGKRGMVPSNYLEVDDTEKQFSCSKIRGSLGIIIKDFEAHYPSEISVRKNEIVDIIRVLSGDWMEIKVGSQSGLLPAHHVNSFLD